MKRVLFDQSTPRPTQRYLTKHMVRTAAELGWERLSNGLLLSAAEEAGFDVFLSGDRNIPSQQTMNGRKLAVLCMTANNWPIVQPHIQNIVDAVESAVPGTAKAVWCGEFQSRRKIDATTES